MKVRQLNGEESSRVFIKAKAELVEDGIWESEEVQVPERFVALAAYCAFRAIEEFCRKNGLELENGRPGAQ